MLERLPRTHRINADLHCHSVVSDGTLKPEDVVERAHRNRVEILALTDHDEVAGLAGAQERARQLGMAFVPGVEVSVTWAGDTIHIVGLRIDFRDAALIAVAQHLEHDEIAGYGCARTWASLLGHRGVASALQRTLNEERRVDERLTRLAESLNRAAVEPVPA